MIKPSLKWITLWLVLYAPVMAQKEESSIAAKTPKYEIVANEPHKKTSTRSIFVFTEDKVFNSESISKVIHEIGKQFCDPYILSITIFSDRKMLEWYMRGLVDSSIVHFSTTPEGRTKQAEYYAKIFPPKTGYLRAFYRRNERFEYFTISPKADSIETKLIVVEDQTRGLKADGYTTFPKSGCKAGMSVNDRE